MKSLALFELTDVEELATPVDDQDITLDSPAAEVFTDFARHTPRVIDSATTAAETVELMKKMHVRLMFVIDEGRHFVGIVTRDDLNSQEIVKRLAADETHRDELMVTDFMQPRSRLKAFNYQELEEAVIGDVVEALKYSGQQHYLVLDRETHKIRGIFSSSDIARKLHLAIDIQNRSSFLHIFEAIHA